jgi:hypothetical protein
MWMYIWGVFKCTESTDMDTLWTSISTWPGQSPGPTWNVDKVIRLFWNKKKPLIATLSELQDCARVPKKRRNSVRQLGFARLQPGESVGLTNQTSYLWCDDLDAPSNQWALTETFHSKQPTISAVGKWLYRRSWPVSTLEQTSAHHGYRIDPVSPSRANNSQPMAVLGDHGFPGTYSLCHPERVH